MEVGGEEVLGVGVVAGVRDGALSRIEDAELEGVSGGAGARWRVVWYER